MDTMGGRDGHELVDGAGYEGLCSGNGGRVLKKGPWTPAEDAILMDYVKKHGEGNWNAVQKYSGLFRCGKSCRLRWANHLRPNLKKGAFTAEEEQLIIELHARMGNKWARMAAHLPGRTDNEIKNYWNTRIKRHQRAGLPLYPSNLCRQILDGNQLSRTSDSENGNRQHNEILHSGSLGVYETIFDSFMPSSHNFSVSKILDQFLGSHGSGDTPTPFKLFNEAKTWSPSSCGSLARGFPTFQQYAETKLAEDGQHFGPHFPVNSHPGRKSLPTFEDTNPSSHGLNGNLSTFQPLSGTVKLELPSFQCSEMGSSGSNTSSASPSEQDANLDILTTEAVPPNSVSMVNGSSLFEAVLCEEHKLRHANHEGYLNAPNSSFASNQLIGYAIPNSCATDWDACNALSTGASTFSDNSDIRSILTPGSQSNCTSGLDVKLQSAEPISNLAVVEKLETPQRDFSRPDALLDSNWFIWHPIGSSGEEPYDLKTQKPGAPVSLRDGHCLYACPLNDMPPVC